MFAFMNRELWSLCIPISQMISKFINNRFPLNLVTTGCTDTKSAQVRKFKNKFKHRNLVIFSNEVLNRKKNIFVIDVIIILTGFLIYKNLIKSNDPVSVSLYRLDFHIHFTITIIWSNQNQNFSKYCHQFCQKIKIKKSKFFTNQ